ncbi:MAG: hypothetical protein F6K39_46045, partial [Okeania sp. SIO3B3]|nr:hypothetical protein [Okeania sp. SIO3B3]
MPPGGNEDRIGVHPANFRKGAGVLTAVAEDDVEPFLCQGFRLDLHQVSGPGFDDNRFEAVLLTRRLQARSAYFTPAAVGGRTGQKNRQLHEGIFALAIWDREEKELWIGRDRVGGRTLYYTTTDSTIWISPR